MIFYVVELLKIECGRTSWKYPRNLNRPECHLQALVTIQDDGNVIDVTAQVAKLQRRMRIRYLAVTAVKQTSTASDLLIRPVLFSLLLPDDSFKADRVQTSRAIGLYAQAVRCVPLTQLTVACD
ncbi:hypothetical protein AVEN_128408-1 [Araneus ventricosus]|uniref:Uncharacterized protein n=1 Tax=Araneus ventricosus TaxID=182803 RepID=A0A4Y2S9T0_ARAVE|nr:hypothetical protein AVEN_128408-1 [Araneus ventricosus]